MTRTATVLQAGHSSHPESGRDWLRVEINAPYSAWSNTTWLWLPLSTPAPSDGETIQYDDNHVWIKGVRYRQTELSSDPNKPL